MHTAHLLDQLDALVASRSILRHPFYEAWTRGELTRGQLRAYAATYYHHVAAFPSYLEAAAAGASDPDVRATLARNLTEGLTDPAPHRELWLDFAEALDLDREAVMAGSPDSATTVAIGTFARLTAGDTAGALAALYAYESQQPEVATEKCRGLREVYGVSSPEALAYFDVHAVMDVDHRAAEREALARCLDAGANPDDLMASADAALSAYWQLLDGICAQVGIESRGSSTAA